MYPFGSLAIQDIHIHRHQQTQTIAVATFSIGSYSHIDTGVSAVYYLQSARYISKMFSSESPLHSQIPTTQKGTLMACQNQKNDKHVKLCRAKKCESLPISTFPHWPNARMASGLNTASNQLNPKPALRAYCSQKRTPIPILSKK